MCKGVHVLHGCMYVHVRYSQHLETDLGEASITIDGDGAQHEGGDDHDLPV
jgi:hypothetical protein